MASHSNYSNCHYNDMADCFNCPYPDCKASVRDIKRQESIKNKELLAERNKKVIELWNSGMEQKYIAERMKMSVNLVSHVVRQARKKDKSVRK